jgi:hypothetical protein
MLGSLQEAGGGFWCSKGTRHSLILDLQLFAILPSLQQCYASGRVLLAALVACSAANNTRALLARQVVLCCDRWQLAMQSLH